MARKRTIQPKDYLEYLKSAWDPRNAAEALGCSIADIRALQKSKAFVAKFVGETVGWSGPESWREKDEYATLQEAIAARKFEAFDKIMEIVRDDEAPPAVRMRALQNIVDRSLVMEGYSPKLLVDHKHEHNHNVMSLDMDTIKAIEAAKMEARRLEAPTIDVTPERV